MSSHDFITALSCAFRFLCEAKSTAHCFQYSVVFARVNTFTNILAQTPLIYTRTQQEEAQVEDDAADSSAITEPREKESAGLSASSFAKLSAAAPKYAPKAIAEIHLLDKYCVRLGPTLNLFELVCQTASRFSQAVRKMATSHINETNKMSH